MRRRGRITCARIEREGKGYKECVVVCYSGGGVVKNLAGCMNHCALFSG